VGWLSSVGLPRRRRDPRQSRDEKPLNRYFPELLEPLQSQLPARCVLDGEIVIANDKGLDFDALQLRIHPAASRVKSPEIPASIVFFDLLSGGDQDLRSVVFQERRLKLESLLSSAVPPIHLTPATSDLGIAADWFRRFEGAGLDGVIAKPVSGTYEPNKRVMLRSNTNAIVIV
jgi:ATP-dependent DNA ligase